MKIGVMGASGRMGRALIRQIIETDGFELGGGYEPEGYDAVGEDLGLLAGLDPLGVSVTTDALELMVHLDGIVDFTAPDASVEFAGLSAQARIVHIIGTTGFTSDQDRRIAAASRHARIVKAGNMSLGVNMLAGLVRRVAALLDPEWDIEIFEMHHRHKVDAPSGTALMLGRAAAEGRGVDLDEARRSGRDGMTGPREKNDIGFASLRGGSVIGEHSAIFATENERIVLSHKAEDRSIFARGALKAARWAFDQKPGLYSMEDVLGF